MGVGKRFGPIAVDVYVYIVTVVKPFPPNAVREYTAVASNSFSFQKCVCVCVVYKYIIFSAHT